MKPRTAKELAEIALEAKTRHAVANGVINNIVNDAIFAARRGEWQVEGRTQDADERRYIESKLKELGFRVRIGSWDFGRRGGCMDPSMRGYKIIIKWGPRWWERK